MTGQLDLRPDALDYLAGSTLDFGSLPEPGGWQVVPSAARRLAVVRGVGVGVGEVDPLNRVAAPLTEPLLAGLAGESIPFAFEVLGGPSGVRFSMGTWVEEPSAASVIDHQHTVVTSLLDGLFAGVDRADGPVDGIGAFSVAGVAHGVPRADAGSGPAPWDRLLRSMQALPFAVLVLAEPIDPSTLVALRDLALDDMRSAQAAEDPRGPSPLAKAYAAKVDALVASLDRALSIGGWRTGVYLLGDSSSYWQLSATWRATFTDDATGLPPVRVATTAAAAQAATAWAMPYGPAPPGPRAWRPPFRNQTLLNSRQLAAFAHLPRLDTPGFAVRPAPAFAVSRPSPTTDQSVAIGEILTNRRPTGSSYAVSLDQLTRHAFVAGLTGSGKTNTLMHLLGQAAAAGLPFLVIEPAKTEYRELLGREEFGSRVRVFTIGREHVSPLRLNPFDVPPGVDVATHLDLLKAVFMGSFALWIPLPQILEQCLVDLYTERGWDFAAGPTNPDGSDARPVPTLGDLVEAVERTVPALGYKAESTQEITAALTTRLNALRRGTRGLMLDVEQSVPMGEILSAPTMLELEGLGDDADKAFVMGLVLTRLYEHRRAEQAAALAASARDRSVAAPSGRLRHIVVVEEAHRLLTASKKSTDSWTADPQGAFSDTFGQMLSEVRAYGQAVIVADQVPVRLAPDVLKNTNLKIIHRLVAGEDRAAVAGAMSMSESQSTQLSVFPPGRAAVFSEGDYTPVIVQVPRAKDRPDARPIDDTAVADAMTRWRESPDVATWFAGSATCPDVCRDPIVCRSAQLLAGQPAARLLAGRLFHTSAEHPDGFDAVWPDVEAYVRARTPVDIDAVPRVHAFAAHALARVTARRAVQGNWSAQDVHRLEALTCDLVEERMASGERWLGTTDARTAFISLVATLQRRTHDPFSLCAQICADGDCRYLSPLTDARLTSRHELVQAEPDWTPEQLVGAATSLAQDVTETSAAAPTGGEALNAARWRAVGCAAQVLVSDTDHAAKAATRVAEAMTQAGWPLDSSLDERGASGSEGGDPMVGTHSGSEA
jgi:hypothetical protein